MLGILGYGPIAGIYPNPNPSSIELSPGINLAREGPVIRLALLSRSESLS